MVPHKTIQGRADRDFHLAMFSVELPLHFLKLAGCKPGDRVLDPFMGTGATLVAAQRLGLDATGIEIDPGYCEAARRRLNPSNHLPNRNNPNPNRNSSRNSNRTPNSLPPKPSGDAVEARD